MLFLSCFYFVCGGYFCEDIDIRLKIKLVMEIFFYYIVYLVIFIVKIFLKEFKLWEN